MGWFSKPDQGTVDRVAEAMIQETDALDGGSDADARRATAARVEASKGATNKELNLAVDQHNRCR